MAYVSNLIHNKKTNYLNNFPGNETDSEELGKFTHETGRRNLFASVFEWKIDSNLNESADQSAKYVHTILEQQLQLCVSSL